MNLETTLNRNLFKYAVQRAIFNEDGSVADVRRSVLVTITVPATVSADGISHPEATASRMVSGTRFDTLRPMQEVADALPAGGTVEVWDGRYLFGSRKGDGYLVYRNPVPADHPSLF